MKIKETKLGGGLSRLDAIPMVNAERNMPVEVIDEMMRDIIRRKNNGIENERHDSYGCHCNNNNYSRLMTNYTCDNNRIKPMREPDGIDVHVDRPLRENFYHFSDWYKAMDKYRTLERVAKDCDWECREPMKGVNELRGYENDYDECDYEDDYEWEVNDDCFHEDNDNIVIKIYW